MSVATATLAYTAEAAALHAEFRQDRGGAKCIAAFTAATDRIVRDAWQQHLSSASGLAVFAVGGYGRAHLFPASDIDLLILAASPAAEKRQHEAIRRFTQSLWDSGMRAAAANRTMAECARLNPENSEFTFALLDARELAGDERLRRRFIAEVLPELFKRERVPLMRRLVELSRVRHEKFGNTIYHLEPNVKETPGMLRDLHTCGWLSRLLATNGGAPLPQADELVVASAYFTAVRCFLHFRAGRDDNTLYWQAQDEAAAMGIGTQRAVDTSLWMRSCFRHARNVQRETTALLNEAAAMSKSVYMQLARWRAQPRSDEYRVRNAQIAPARPLSDGRPLEVLHLFSGMARTGLPLNRETEARIAELLPHLSEALRVEEIWSLFRALLLEPHASCALRAMHSLGVLELLVPEFHGIDALVVRDAWHRYTVDEHTFILMDALERVANLKAEQNTPSAEQQFAALHRELEQPELLRFAALMHDTGKGRRTEDHTAASAELADAVLSRWLVPPESRAVVERIIRSHLVMSAALRRDIFDANTVRTVAAAADTAELLRMLTLLTWADIQAVHPDALTPFKAANLWQLYIATSNYLDRSLDEQRIESAAEDPQDAARMTAVLTANQDLGISLVHFLAGLPRRYLRTHSRAVIGEHCRMAQRLTALAPVHIMTQPTAGGFEVSIVTTDREFLFANIAGSLAAQGMNILKAEAFSNAAGIVVDTFRFADTYGTLEQNPDEIARFEQRLNAAVTGAIHIAAQVESRQQARRRRGRKRAIAPRISFDDTSSAQSTVVQVIAQDMPGLLYTLSRIFAEHKCNIGTALIDTEGDQAIDVFYLTKADARLTPEEEHSLAEALSNALVAV